MNIIEVFKDRDELGHITSFIDENSLFAFSQSCITAHECVVCLKKPLKTTYKSVISSHSLIVWALSMGASIKYLSYVAAKEVACVGVLQELKKNGGCLKNLTANSAMVGDLSVLQWAFENNYCVNKSTFEYAAVGGNVNMIKWLYTLGCPWDKEVCSRASQFGNMDALKWLHENGCPWDADTFSFAALRGDIEMLEWLRENECPWSTATFTMATSPHFSGSATKDALGTPTHALSLPAMVISIF